MPSRTDRTAGEVDWPEWAERTPAGERKRTSKFSVTQHQATKRLESELLDRVDADDWRLSTAAAHRKSDGMPYADANPGDPGVVVRWTKEGEQYAVGCDEYTDLRDNIRTIGLYIEEKRKMSNRPVRTGRDEFSTARLPSGDGEEAIVASRPPHEVLGIEPDASDAEVKEALRERVKKVHPDHSDQEGEAEEFHHVKKAKEAMLS